MAHTHIAHIWQYPPPPGLKYNYDYDDDDDDDNGDDNHLSDRLDRSGGGTLTAIKTFLSSSEVPIPSDFSSLKVVVVEIGSLKNDRSILVINCYRPPSDFDFVSRFSGFLQSLEINQYYSILAVGDFNFPNIQWVHGRFGFRVLVFW